MVWLVHMILQIRVEPTQTLSDNAYEKVPPLHQMDNFLQCREKGNMFCRIQFTLRPRSIHSKVWQTIQETKNNPNYFNRDVVYRYRCFPKDLDGRTEELIGNATVKENKLLRNFSLNAHVDDLECKNYSEEPKLTTFDYALLYSTLAWFGLIAAATLCDIIMKIFDLGGVLEYSKPLSILSNWEELKTPSKNQDYQRLKCLQGIRTFNLAIVILGHSIFNALFSFTSDVVYVENPDSLNTELESSLPKIQPKNKSAPSTPTTTHHSSKELEDTPSISEIPDVTEPQLKKQTTRTEILKHHIHENTESKSPITTKPSTNNPNRNQPMKMKEIKETRSLRNKQTIN
ncbi:hypothetical protein JTB14_029612 [Gonioctena quinquepunctata]|nr:hypothetical protein JTB14_029612 [Gonioctena quinquepunctata]